MYQNNVYKTITLINKKIEIPKTLNAMGHTTLGLFEKLEQQHLQLNTYTSKDNELLGYISEFPYIVLGADNSNQIYTTLLQLKEQNILHTAFTEAMLGNSLEQQLEQTSIYNLQEHNYFCLTCFGANETLQPIFKKFSLYK